MISVVDYGAGNVESVMKAFRYIGCDVQLTQKAQEIAVADALVLPGVGAFGDAMQALRHSGLIEPVLHYLEQGKPFLGICLGLQLLFEGSEEAPGVPGLGVLHGRILRIPSGAGLKIPHIGWNSLHFLRTEGLFRGLADNAYVYFVHSYYLHADDREDVSATTEYGVSIDAAVQRGNLCAVQFHPEKSGEIGLQMLRNFAAMQ